MSVVHLPGSMGSLRDSTGRCEEAVRPQNADSPPVVHDGVAKSEKAKCSSLSAQTQYGPEAAE